VHVLNLDEIKKIEKIANGKEVEIVWVEKKHHLHRVDDVEHIYTMLSLRFTYKVISELSLWHPSAFPFDSFADNLESICIEQIVLENFLQKKTYFHFATSQAASY
jgi:hypothetical protein